MLTERYKDLVNNIQYSQISDSLCQNGVISTNHLEEIEAQTTNSQKVRTFLNILMRRSLGDYKRFEGCLQSMSHILFILKNPQPGLIQIKCRFCIRINCKTYM